ncbi:MAG: RNA-binding protein [Sulfobacillus acidophilus]|uniref:RQC P-site tRNA stabilizing factor n=1 Tax=Sulfobacillus acidophilus TaxID=53633 RepID=A0A2T2WH60_9FIRM|nr:MAG: RNA-binding protein [Sulfobacillus acidophilus]
MRIDKYLKVSRIIKRRTVAKEVLDMGRVSVNGRVVKAGYEVKVGDRITLDIPGGPRTVIVVAIRDNVPAKDAESLYRSV